LNQPVRRRRRASNSAIPNVIFALLIANGLAFAAQWQIGGIVERVFALHSVGSPYGQFMPWQLLTYGFLHNPGNLTHILFNMFALWMFGRDLERIMGAQRFLTYYLTCVIGAGLAQLLVAGFTGVPTLTVGASGGVFGILLAFAMAFPNRIIMLIFPPIPMPAKYFVFFYGLLELYLGVSGNNPGVAHFAHLGGMFFGYLLLRYWRTNRGR
jgi:membrane associated rhomboid family serine protease